MLLIQTEKSARVLFYRQLIALRKRQFFSAERDNYIRISLGKSLLPVYHIKPQYLLSVYHYKHQHY